MTSEFLDVARQILDSERRPMRPAELVEHALRHKLFSDRIAGKTPHQTMKSKLSVHVRSHGERSPFVRTAPGKFYLRQLLNGSQSVYEAPPLRKPRPKERVLVFPSKWLDDSRWFQGVIRASTTIRRHLFRDSGLAYENRLRAELDNDQKQILTYVLLTRGNQILAFKRGSYNRVEEFLRGSQCVGFGGHVTEPDRGLFGGDMGVEQCAVRELCEELKLPDTDKKRLYDRNGLKLIGLLNDDSSEVGQRHFAFVFRYEVSENQAWDRPERGEKSVTQLRWIDLDHETVNLWEFEYWSQLCLREFFPKSLRAAPTFRVRRKRPLKPPHLLCVLGGVGSGKSEATQVLVEDFGYSEVSTRQLVASLMGIPPIPQTPRELFQEMAWNFIQTPNGPNQLAEAIYSAIDQMSNPRVLVDGIRQLRTLECLRLRAARRGLGLLYIHTLPDLAYEFYREREANDYSIFEFLRVRNAPVEREVDLMIGLSDAVLYNWTGRKQYRRAVRGLMRELLG